MFKKKKKTVSFAVNRHLVPINITLQNSHNRNLKLGVGAGRKEYRLVLGALNNTIVVNIGNKQKHPAPYLETDTLTLGVG